MTGIATSIAAAVVKMFESILSSARNTAVARNDRGSAPKETR
jgi:hypothetical protein